MAIYKNFTGTLKNLFTLGKSANRIGFRTNNGTAELQNKDKPWLPIAQKAMAVRVIMGAAVTLDLTDQVLMCAYAGTITITLPLASTVPEDGHMREFYVKNASGFPVTVITQSPDKFLPGNNKITLNSLNDTVQIGVMYSADGNFSWASIASQEVICQLRKETSWPHTAFSAATAFPFDISDMLDNDTIIGWTSGAPTRIYARVSGRIKISYWTGIDSNGPGTYIVEAFLRKNGIGSVDGSWIRSGNYPSEDQSMGIGVATIPVTMGDYFELMFDHSSLTGDLVGTTLTAAMVV